MFFRLNLWLMHKRSSGVCGIQRCLTGRLRVVYGLGLVRRHPLYRSHLLQLPRLFQQLIVKLLVCQDANQLPQLQLL